MAVLTPQPNANSKRVSVQYIMQKCSKGGNGNNKGSNQYTLRYKQPRDKKPAKLRKEDVRRGGHRKR